MSTPESQPDHDSFATTSPYFPLMCGMEFLPRPVRLNKESREDFERFAELAKLHDWLFDRQRIQLFLQNPANALVITDRRQAIQLVNRGFIRMTGYSKSEVLNRRPSFLQGPDTNPDTKLAISACLAEDQPFSGDILNYRKNGEPYWCRIAIEAILNDKRQPIHYMALEREVDHSTTMLAFR